MSLRTRVRALARRASQVPRPPAAGTVSVCDRIEELTRRYAENPPAFRPEIEAGIAAGVARDEQLAQASE